MLSQEFKRGGPDANRTSPRCPHPDDTATTNPPAHISTDNVAVTLPLAHRECRSTAGSAFCHRTWSGHHAGLNRQRRFHLRPGSGHRQSPFGARRRPDSLSTITAWDDLARTSGLSTGPTTSISGTPPGLAVCPERESTEPGTEEGCAHKQVRPRPFKEPPVRDLGHDVEALLVWAGYGRSIRIRTVAEDRRSVFSLGAAGPTDRLRRHHPVFRAIDSDWLDNSG